MLFLQQLVQEELDLGLVFGFCAGVAEVGIELGGIGLFFEGDAEVDVVDEPAADFRFFQWQAWRPGSCRSS